MTETQKKAFKKNVGKLLIDKEMKQLDLARAIGCSESMTNHVINGTKEPPFKMILAISEALGVTVDDLIK
jgi:DNA-binding Xre family transcriptional regulator